MNPSLLTFLSLVFLLISVWIPQLSFFIWFAFVPYLIATKCMSWKKSGLYSFGLGILFFSGFLYWIGYYEWRIFFIVIALTSPFLAIFGMLIAWIRRHIGSFTIQILAPSLAWLTVSSLYLLTPLGIMGDQIAIFQSPQFPILTQLIGVSGIAFLILLSNSLISLWILTKRELIINWAVGLTILLLIGTFWKVPIHSSNSISVAIVQHNFPIESSWRFKNKDEVLKTYEEAIKNWAGKTDLIIFPQYGLPIDVLREPEWLSKLVREHQTSVLLGTYIPKVPGGNLEQGEKIDTALLFSPDGQIQEYQAINPPPFRNIGQILGTKRIPLVFKGIKMGILLCYEDTRPEDAKLWMNEGAEVLIALSNPGHFLGTTLPRYHLLHDRIRAIETKRFVVRASPNGYSAIIDPSGKVLTQSELNEEETLNGVIKI